MVNKASVVLSLVTVIVALLVLEIGELPDHTRLWREILNAGHIPLFGILALAMLRLSTELLAKEIQNRYVHYVTALTAAAVIGAGAELLQIFLPRDADVVDFAKNVAGAACFLAIQSTRDARLTSSWKAANAVSRTLLLSVSTLVLIAALAPLLIWAAAYLQRSYAFPQIVSFDSYLSRLFVEAQDAELQITKPPQDWHTAHAERVGRLNSGVGQYPGLWVNEPYPDWASYRFLRMGVYSEMGNPIQLTIRIHDRLHNDTYEDRFNESLTVRPGANSIQIPIERIRSAPEGRELDLENVAAIGIFAVKPQSVYTINIDRIWVE